MLCQEINDQAAWDGFFAVAPLAPFWQSWTWGEIKSGPLVPLRLAGLAEDGQWRAAASFIRTRLPGRSLYYYCPRGPYAAGVDQAASAVSLLRAAIVQADREQAIFVRFEPLFPLRQALADLGRPVQPVLPVQPKSTLIQNISLPETSILEGMRPKTRYNIRLSEKKKLVLKSGSAVPPADFLDLIAATGRRDGFRPHPRSYYEKLIKAGQNVFLRLYLVYDQGRPAAGALNSYFGDMITYLHGASDYECRRSMAPYFLHWRIIQAGQQAGFHYYDWHGVDPIRWPGVTRFKIGFGGQVLDYPGAYDIILRPAAYRLYRLARAWRRRFHF